MAAAEVRPAVALGLGRSSTRCPATAGRNVVKLAELSRGGPASTSSRPTGLHHERYYDDRHWSVRARRGGELADLFAPT